MTILGIDPGSMSCGYGVIEYQRGIQTYVSSGKIVMPLKTPLHNRLKELFVCLKDILEQFTPEEIAIEKIFFAKGIKAALSLGHTRGVILAAAALSGKPIFEYSALEIKKAVVGYGRADKRQVQSMVSKILLLKHPISSDSADALATAICHANTTANRRG
jgi:crossover junction endodeoxyribonuclease RuvC